MVEGCKSNEVGWHKMKAQVVAKVGLSEVIYSRSICAHLGYIEPKRERGFNSICNPILGMNINLST